MSDVFVLPHPDIKRITEVVEEHVTLPDQDFLKPDGSQEMTGNLNLATNKIINLGDPVDGTDAANKAYVDSKYSGGGVSIEGGSGSAFSGDMKGSKIINLGSPANPKDAATKEYVDSKYAGGGVSVEGGSGSAFSGDMKGSKIINLGSPANPKDAATKEYVDSSITIFTGDMLGAKITNLGAPSESTDAGTKQYIDDKVNNIVFPKFNGNMEGKKITNLGAPTVDTDAATRKFVVDSVFKGDAVGNRIVNIGDPVNAGDAANKKYVDSKSIPATKFDILNSNLLDVPVKTGLSVAYDSVNVELSGGSATKLTDLVGDIDMAPQSGFSSTYDNSGKIPFITVNRKYYLKHNPVAASKYVDTDNKSETWFFTAKLESTGTCTMFWWGNGTIRHSAYYEPSNKRFKLHHGNTAEKELLIPYELDLTRTNVICFQRNGDNYKLYVNGEVINTGTHSLTVTGNGQAEILQFYGDFYSFMVYNKGLTDSECDLVNDFLIKKYFKLEDEEKYYYTFDKRVDMGGLKISHIADPVEDVDVVNKKYVDSKLLDKESRDAGFYEELPVKTGVFSCYSATNVKTEDKKVVMFKDLGTRGYDLIPDDKNILPEYVESVSDQVHTYAMFTDSRDEKFVCHSIPHLAGDIGDTTSFFIAVKFTLPENTLSTLLQWENQDRDGKVLSTIGVYIWNTYFSGAHKQFVVKHGAGTTSYDQPNNFDYNSIHIVGFVRSGTNIKLYIDKAVVLEVNNGTGASTGTNDLIMFDHFAGHFYGAILYDRALSLAETTDLNNYMYERYINKVINQKEINTLDTLNVTNSLSLKGDAVATEIYTREYARTYNEATKFTGDMKNQPIINLRPPQNDNDAVNKYYVDHLTKKESILDGIPYTNPYFAYDANHAYAPTGKVDKLKDISFHGKDLKSKYDPHPDFITGSVSDYILFEDNDALVDYGFKNVAGSSGNTVTWFYSCVLKTPHPPEATLFYIGDEGRLINGTAGSHMSLKVINGSSVKVTMGTNVFTANFPVSYTDGDVCVFAYYRSGTSSVLYFNGVKIGELTNNSDNYVVDNDAFLIGYSSNIRFYSMVLYDKVLPVNDILKTSTYFLDRYETNSVSDAIHEVFGNVSINGELRLQDIAIKPTYEEIVTYHLGSINADTVKENEFFFYKKSANRIRPISLYLTGIFHDSNFKFTTSSFVQLDVLAIVEGETIATPPILSIGEEATNSSKDLTKYFSYSNSTSIFYGRSDISQTRLDYFFKIHEANTNIGLKITILKNELRKITQTNSVDYDTTNIYLEVAEERVRNQYF